MRAIFFPIKPQPTHTTEELLCAKSIPAGASTHLSIGPWYRPSRFVIEDEPEAEPAGLPVEPPDA